MLTSILANTLIALFPKSFAKRQQEFFKKKEFIEATYKAKNSAKNASKTMKVYQEKNKDTKYTKSSASNKNFK
jgi:hypothetical protein